MNTSDKFCLKWNSFQTNVLNSFNLLRQSPDFADVTLVSEDGLHFESHKVVLSTASPFFDRLLKGSVHQHPLIYMRGIGSVHLDNILDFIYHGEVQVLQENINALLTLAQELSLRGMGDIDSNTENKTLNFPLEACKEKNTIETKTGRSRSCETTVESSKTTDTKQEQETEDSINEAPKGKLEIKTEPNIKRRTDPLNKYVTTIQSCEIVSPEFQDLDDKINSMMVRGLKTMSNGNKVYLCKVCGKEAQCSNMKSHIKLYHINRASKYRCNLCDTILASKIEYGKHVVQKH